MNECVSAVSRKPASTHQPVRCVQQFLHDNSMCVLPADKDGGFVVLNEGEIASKAFEGVTPVMKICDDVSLKKVKAEGKKLCSRLNLARLGKCLGKSDDLHLKVPDNQICPLDVDVVNLGHSVHQSINFIFP